MKKEYNKKEMEKIVDRACSALSDLSTPRIIAFKEKPFFNGAETYMGWKEYLLTGNINNKHAQKANELYLLKNFTPTSNHPGKEYLNFLKENKKVIEATAITIDNADMSFILKIMAKKIDDDIKKITDDIFFYDVMDKIYAGEQKQVKQTCSEATFNHFMICLKNPTGMVKDIYVDFASYYNMHTSEDLKLAK